MIPPPPTNPVQMKTERTKDMNQNVNISTEDRAARLFETFVAEHDVPQTLHYDLMEEIKLAIDCYDIEDGDSSSVRQSVLYDYMEAYLVKWVADLRESRLPGMQDLKGWGYFDDVEDGGPEILIQPLCYGVKITLHV